MRKYHLLVLFLLQSLFCFAQSVKSLQAEIDSMLSAGIADVSQQLNAVLRMYQQKYTATSPQYADAVQWAARICLEAGDQKKAVQLLSNSDELFGSYGQGVFNGRDSISQIFYLDLCARLEDLSNRGYYAIRLARRASQLKKEYFGPHSEPYLNSLLDVSRLYAEQVKYRQSNDYHNMGYDAYVERIKQEFCQTSESERTRYWDKAIRYINKTLNLAHKSAGMSHRGGSRSLASAAYNAMLLSKGLLLNTTTGFEDFIVNSGNAEAIRNLRLKKTLSEQQATQAVLDSLDYVILHALQARGQTFSLPHLGISWQDVASKLGKNDLAVEFYRTDEDNYGAILLKRDWKSPRVVRLNSLVSAGKSYLPLLSAIGKTSLEHYTPGDASDLWHLSRAIWTDDIVKYFPQKDDGNIYFSADGQLLVTGIEYLPFVEPRTDGSFHSLSDLFNMYRLSSTRELAMEKPAPNGNQVALYGGLFYDMETDDMIADAKRYHESSDFFKDMAYEPHRRAVRLADRAIPYLEGTKTEVDSILTTISHVRTMPLTPTSFTADRGTETSFKSLSGTRQRIIHVATHGYFYDEADSTFAHFHLGDNPMARSGLLLAGADNKWLGDSVPQGVDDGFLTALEISNLDLRGLDLTVLSACETAKGNVKGDGVFGLQRGFKMANANSILMSLWKVDDEATCHLMTEFYRNWIGRGLTKHDALEQARQAVRSHREKGWNHPQYWAAFILLDALD